MRDVEDIEKTEMPNARQLIMLVLRLVKVDQLRQASKGVRWKSDIVED